MLGPSSASTQWAASHEIASLLSLVARLLPGRSGLTDLEAECLAEGGRANHEPVEHVRAQILDGHDPLGDALMKLRAPIERRAAGAVFTPQGIVDSMVGWAASQGIEPVRIVDPGAGTGRFILKAGRAFPDARLIAVDTDPVALLALRANAEVHGLTSRLVVIREDYRKATLPATEGPTLFIGNPPYVRHHHIGRDEKAWFAATARTLGLKASRLAGLHAHFFLRTRQLARRGDFGAFVTSAEWLDVNYGDILRRMLADGLGGTSLHVLAAEAMPFDATTTGAIACFRVGSTPDMLRVRSVESVDNLGDLNFGKAVPWTEVRQTPRWSILIRGGSRPSPGEIELGEVFRVHRGQVTGANAIWVEGAYRGRLPDAVLYPSITRARELFAAGPALTCADGLRNVIDIAPDLACLPDEDRRLIDAFLEWAKEQGADESYISRHRKRWWSVGLRAPASILCTYMARRSPAFVLNAVGARHLNIAHGLYPRERLPQSVLEGFVRFLGRTVDVRSGRTYAGGLTKFEPKEIERLAVPRPDRLHDCG